MKKEIVLFFTMLSIQLVYIYYNKNNCIDLHVFHKYHPMYFHMLKCVKAFLYLSMIVYIKYIVIEYLTNRKIR